MGKLNTMSSAVRANKNVRLYGKILKTKLETINICIKDIYPNMYFAFKALRILPVPITTPERMFSTFIRVKTYLKNTMSKVYLLFNNK